MHEVQYSGSEGIDGHVGGDEVGTFADQVHYIHYHVIAIGFGKFDYKVYTDGVPMSLGDGEGLKFAHRSTLLCLHLNT